MTSGASTITCYTKYSPRYRFFCWTCRDLCSIPAVIRQNNYSPIDRSTINISSSRSRAVTSENYELFRWSVRPIVCKINKREIRLLINIVTFSTRVLSLWRVTNVVVSLEIIKNDIMVLNTLSFSLTFSLSLFLSRTLRFSPSLSLVSLSLSLYLSLSLVIDISAFCLLQRTRDN